MARALSSGSLALASLVLTFVAAAAGQPTPAGASLTIKVQQSNSIPISGARVAVAGSPLIHITNERGESLISGVAPGVISIGVTADDFYPNQAKRIEVSPALSTTVVITLERRVMVDETVVVTATGTRYQVEDAPIRTELITREVVDRQVKTTLAEAFQATISGVRMEMNCQNCGFMQIRINGLEGPYTQILEDGLPNYSGVAAVYGLEQIPASFLEQIEVVKGGNSALYGPGAVAGVVNLVRREPSENRFRADVIGGWQSGSPEQQVGLAAQTASLPLGFSGDFYYRYSNRVAVDRDGDGFTDLGKRNLQAGGAGLFRRFLDGNARLSINATRTGEFRRGGDQLDRPAHETWITEQVNSHRSTLSTGWNHTISPVTFYNLRTSYAYYGRDTYYGAGMDPNAYGDTRNPLSVSDAQIGHQAGRHSLLAGYQMSWEHVEDNAPAYQRTYGGTFRNQGVYFQDEWRANARLTVIGGARIDKSNRLDKVIASPRAGAKFAFTGNLVWRATFSTGFRAPAVFDEDLHIAQVGGEGFLLQNSPDLREERSNSFMNGMDYAGRAFGRRFKLGANFFHTNLKDAFMLDEEHMPDAGFRRLIRVNGHGAHVTGVDIDGNIQVTAALAFRGGFTAQRARWTEPESQFGATDFFRAPRTYGFLGADLDLPAKIQISATADYTGSMLVPHYAGYIPNDRLEQTRRFVVGNLVAGRTFEVSDQQRIRLFVNLQNLGDAYQRDLDRGPNRDSAYVYGPSEMRRIVGGLTWEF